jgi:4-hydroxybenzoate polyprenyltransferase
MEFLNNTKAYLWVLRPKNLVIIGLTHYLLQYLVIIPRVDSVVLHGILFPLFVFTTIIIGASGYLVNDILDQKTDAVNKPQNQFVGKQISEFRAWTFYLFLITLGALTSVYIAHNSDNWSYISLYPMATWSMYLYSRFLKSTILLGNIFVSAFVAFVWGILFLAQNTHYSLNNAFLQEMCLVYMCFAFLTNLLREIIKDIEDIDGDKEAQVITIPIVVGIPKTKWIIKTVTLLFVIGLTVWLLASGWTQSLQIRAMLSLFVIAPLGSLIVKLNNANNKIDFAKMSSLLKWVMLAGLVSIVVISKNVL